jgi:hypothetical protein
MHSRYDNEGLTCQILDTIRKMAMLDINRHFFVLHTWQNPSLQPHPHPLVIRDPFQQHFASNAIVH